MLVKVLAYENEVESACKAIEAEERAYDAYVVSKTLHGRTDTRTTDAFDEWSKASMKAHYAVYTAFRTCIVSSGRRVPLERV